MNNDGDVKKLLTEIRDQQAMAIKRQEEHLEIAREQLERSRKQVAESIELQKQAMDRFKSLSKIVIPAIFVCLLLIAILVLSFF